MPHPIVHAVTASPSVVHTPCQIRHVRWTQPDWPCNRCFGPAPRVWDASRTAIDLDLDAPVLLQITVSVHRCPACRHHFRAQPPFLRPDAIYLNRVVAKAVQAVAVDGLAFRRVPERLARDFGVRPSEASVRLWWRLYSMHLEDQETYLPWVVEEFSGILCVDEVYQGQLALLLAVDPAAPSGDRLVGYQLVDGPVDRDAVAAFLTRLKEDAGICPDEVITDGSTLYPALLAAIWPTAAHQLCLFHETRHITEAAAAVLTLARHTLPTPPPRPRQGRGGPLSAVPPTPHRDDPATQQWHLRRAASCRTDSSPCPRSPGLLAARHRAPHRTPPAHDPRVARSGDPVPLSGDSGDRRASSGRRRHSVAAAALHSSAARPRAGSRAAGFVPRGHRAHYGLAPGYCCSLAKDRADDHINRHSHPGGARR